MLKYVSPAARPPGFKVQLSLRVARAARSNSACCGFPNCVTEALVVLASQGLVRVESMNACELLSGYAAMANTRKQEVWLRCSTDSVAEKGGLTLKHVFWTV